MAGTTEVGLHITTDNLRLIGKTRPGQGEDGKVRLVASGSQETGSMRRLRLAGPRRGWVNARTKLQGFYIRGFTVKDYDWNGIQTRFVDDFKIIRNEAGNGRNGRDLSDHLRERAGPEQRFLRLTGHLDVGGGLRERSSVRQ